MKKFSVSLVVFISAISLGIGAEVVPETFPPHPRLLLNAADLPSIKERMAAQPWARERFGRLKGEADGLLKQKVVLPAKGGQWFHYYSCPNHGARLRTEGPTRHVCPVDKEVFTGYPYDDVVLMSEHNRLANGIRTLGLVYQVTGDSRYAAKSKEILLAYAAKYESYPLHTIRGEAKIGGGKVGPQTLDESTWLITVVQGADCIWAMLTEAEQKQVTEGLLKPATDIIRQHKMGIHNIQCWKNSAVGLTGLLLGDRALVDEALNGNAGYFKQMAKGISADGAWFEGAWGYHFYTLSAVLHLTEGALHSGINLYGTECKRMFDGPLAMAMPDLRLPAFNDSHEVSILGQAALYETALARYKDERYRTVLARGKRDSNAAWLHGVADLEKAALFRCVSTNFPPSGCAILAAGEGPGSVWLTLDYGPHGGGHGHPDKLGFVLYAHEGVIAPDPGTANYGVPIQAGWHRTTIAHNTLTVDEGSQKAAEGSCEAFVAEEGFSAVMATAGAIYPGVVFRRTVALITNKLVIFIDEVNADKEHVFDLAYHNTGKVVDPGWAPFEKLSSKPGYSYLRDLQQSVSPEEAHVDITRKSEGTIRWAMAGGEPTTFFAGTGVGAHTEDRVPVVIARRKAKNTVFVWSIALDGDKSLEAKVERVKSLDGTTLSAARIKSGTGDYVIIANPGGKQVEFGGKQLTGKIVALSQETSGGWRGLSGPE